ncbi:MAG: shikimate kinase [Polyangiales bacterium]
MVARAPILLTGAPGAGKSRLAPALAAQLGLECVDLDARVAARAGMPVAALIQARGEPAFRALERELLEGILGLPAPCVVALGGGALVSTSLRRRALREAAVLRLDAPREVLLRRVVEGPPRPLVTSAKDPARALNELLDARDDGYAEAHLSLRSDGGDVAALAREAARALSAPLPLVVPSARGATACTSARCETLRPRGRGSSRGRRGCSA